MKPITRRRFLGGLGSLGAVVAFPGLAHANPASGFVRRSGPQYVVNRRPWRLFGGSTYGTLNPGGQGTIPDTLSLALQAGLNTLRIVNFFDERGLDPAAPYDPASWARVDAMLAALRANGLWAILDLSAYRNHLQNLALNTGSSITPYSQDWSGFVRFVAKRVNTVNGLPYKNDPTIAFVSFAGEPNPPASQEPLKPTTAELTNFYSTVFGQWRRWDRNHMLGSGGLLHIDWEEAFGNPAGSGIDWQAIFALRDNDVPAIHSYWHNFPPSATNDYRSPKVSAYCAQIGKPWVTEEFGFLQRPVDYSTDPPTVYTEEDRGNWYKVAYDIQAQYGSSGCAFWNLGREVSPYSYDANPDTPATWATVLANVP